MDEDWSDRESRYRRERRQRRRRRRIRTAVPVVLIALAVGALGTAFKLTHDRIQEAAARAVATGGETGADGTDETVVVVVGDEFTAGTAMNGGPAWARRLADEQGWTLHEDAVPGSGYLTGDTFADRLDTIEGIEADLVILAGGHHDRPGDPKELRAVRQEVEAVTAGFPSTDVVLFSPFASGTPTPLESRRATGFRGVADEFDVGFVGVTDMLTDRLVGADGLYPDDDGQERLAERIGRQLDRLDVPRADAFRPGLPRR